MMIEILLVFIALWWSCGIIATVMLLRQGKICDLFDFCFLCLLSAFTGPIAFTLLRD